MKYFVVSDIHSFATELKLALNHAGFNKKNKNHTLIVVGDVFDRGSETVETYEFLSSIPKKRCILIRGNHEYLFRDLLKKSYPQSHDFSNHTVDTFCHIAHRDIGDLHCGDVDWKEITDYVKLSKIWAWLNSKQWVNYFEVGPYIFTHSFIPVNIQERYKVYEQIYGSYARYELSGKAFEYRSDWREAKDWEWEEASWGDPVDYYQNNLFQLEEEKGKVLVVGHWHVSDFWDRLGHRKSYEGPMHDIYRGEGIIGLDGGVFRIPGEVEYYHPQNVLVIDDSDYSKVYDQYGAELRIIKPAPIRETVTLKEGETVTILEEGDKTNEQ